jgi:hypothetical protein
MHVGTFTPEGNWEGALRELPALAELGITCLEIMPVAEFPGASAGDTMASISSHQHAFTVGRLISAASSTVPMPSGSRSSLTSSTIISARTETISNCSSRLISLIDQF